MRARPLVIDIRAVLSFYDDPPTGANGHVSAITAVAGEELGAVLLKEYLSTRYTTVEILPDRCTPGTTSGGRLDRWVLVDGPNGNLLYQVEIKNWSAKSLGGKHLPVDAAPGTVERYKKERWAHEWDGAELRQKETRKVLTPMKSPRQSITVKPLLCFWTALHPDGASSPFFTVPLPAHSPFDQLSVFSMSSYLRTLSQRTITIEMPLLAQRLFWLQQMFSLAGSA